MYIILSRNNCHLISPFFFLSGPRKFTDESKKKKLSTRERDEEGSLN